MNENKINPGKQIKLLSSGICRNIAKYLLCAVIMLICVWGFEQTAMAAIDNVFVPSLGEDIGGSSCSHSYSAATCTKPKTCTKCGTTSGSALGHDLKYSNINANNGHAIYCSRNCGYSSTGSHRWTQTSTTEATCTQPKWLYYTCSLCDGQTCDTSGSALGHDYTSQTTTSTYLASSATCTSAATYYYKCSRCTSKSSSTYTYGSSLGHDLKYSNINANNGHAIYCSRNCGYSSTGSHRWTQTSTTEATCTQPKWLYYTCSLCDGQTCDTSGSALGHDYGSTTYTWGSGHTSCTASATCSRCNNVKTEVGTVSRNTYHAATCTDDEKWDYKATFSSFASKVCPDWHSGQAAFGHNYSAATCTKPATCTRCSATTGSALGHNLKYSNINSNNGHAIYCSRNCGYSSTGSHSWIYSSSTEATCTQPKWLYYTCSLCDGQTCDTSGSALGHSFKYSNIDIGAGHTKSCQRSGCSYSTTESHSWGSGTLSSSATCTSAAVYSYSCSYCSASKTVGVGSALGHDYGSTTYTWGSGHTSCTASATCSRCNNVKTEVGTVSRNTYHAATCTDDEKWDYKATFSSFASKVCPDWHRGQAAFGHNYSAATCTNPRTCTRCSETSGSALGHNYVNNVCTRCGNKTFNINGVWKFYNTFVGYDLNNDGYGASDEIKQSVNFTSNGSSYDFIHETMSGTLTKPIFLNYGGTDVYRGTTNGSSGDWTDSNYRVIEFGPVSQPVSEEFYDWFTSSASRVTCAVIFNSNNGIWDTAATSLPSGMNRYTNRQVTQHVGATYSDYGGFPTSPSKTGYVFSGWYTAASGGTRVLLSSEVPASGCTLYAHWEPIEYTIRYDSNGGSGYTNDSEHIYDVAKNLTTNGFSKYGCKFMGWATTRDRANSYIVDYKNAAYVKNLTTVDGAILTMYAVWCDHPSEYVTASYSWNSNHTSCTATGTCSQCGYNWTESGTVSQNNYYGPSCCAEGKYDHIAIFDTLPSNVCPSWHPIEKLPHLWSTDEDDITYTWNSDHTSCTATTVCVRSCCVGKNVTYSESGTTTQVNYTAPTCTTQGKYQHKATFASLGSTICPTWHNIDALGHLWSTDEDDITYTWNSDHTSCTATTVCVRSCCVGKNVTYSESGRISQNSYIAPTCTERGRYDHIATFDTLPSDVCPSWHYIDALGHLWSDTTYTWNSGHTSCTAEKHCTRTRCTASVTEQGAITRAHDTAPTPTAQSRYRHKATFDTLGSSTCPTWHYYDVEITNITFKYIGSSGAMETITDLDNIPYGITIYVYHTYRNNTELPVTVNGYHNSESSMVSYNNTTVFTIEAGKTKTVMAGSFTPGIGNGTYIGYVYMDGYAFGNTSAEDNSGNNSKSVNYRAVFDVELVEVYLADKNGNRLNTSKLMTNMKAYVHHVYRNNSAGPVSLDLYHDGVKCATISNVKGNSTQDVVVTEIILNNAGNVSYAGAIYRKGMTATTEQFETILANNTKSVSLAVIKSPELEASGTTADFTYRAGVEVIASFNLTNNSDVNYIPADPLTITMRIYDSKGILVHEMSQNAIVPAHKMQLVWFRWTAPDKDGTYKIVASVKYSDIEDELNVLEKNCKVQSRSAVSSTDTSYEGNMPDGWSNKDKKPTIKNETATWTVWEYKNNQFVEVKYGITANAGSAIIVPSSKTAYQEYGKWYMKSGYGITIGASDATIGSLSGYTMPSADAYTNTQWSYGIFPEFGYRTNEQTTLERINGTWVFNGSKLHYTPIWYPDSTADANAYYVKLVQTDIWTPAGKLTVSGPSTGIWIEGDMYDDWYTS